MANYNYGGYTAPAGITSRNQVRAMQHQLGVTADGLWGPNTQAAYEASQGGYGGYGGQGGYGSGSFDYGTLDLDALERQILSKLTVPSVSYNLPSTQEIMAEVAAYLRPSYDAAIGQRKKQTLYNRSEIDADAVSRGMGRSTYVTDVKDQAMDAESADISGMESAYSAALAQTVQSQYNQHLHNKLAADQYNASASSAAQQAALQYAMGLYGNNVSAQQAAQQAALKAAGRASSRSSNKKTSGSAYTQQYHNVKTALQYYSPAERAAIYYGGTQDGIRHRNEIIGTLGPDAFDRLMREVPA